MLSTLESIDDEARKYGIEVVKIDDKLIAKKYGFRFRPGLGFFRKGLYLKYEGEHGMIYSKRTLRILFSVRRRYI